MAVPPRKEPMSACAPMKGQMRRLWAVVAVSKHFRCTHIIDHDQAFLSMALLTLRALAASMSGKSSPRSASSFSTFEINGM